MRSYYPDFRREANDAERKTNRANGTAHSLERIPSGIYCRCTSHACPISNDNNIYMISMHYDDISNVQQSMYPSIERWLPSRGVADENMDKDGSLASNLVAEIHDCFLSRKDVDRCELVANKLLDDVRNIGYHSHCSYEVAVSDMNGAGEISRKWEQRLILDLIPTFLSVEYFRHSSTISSISIPIQELERKHQHIEPSNPNMLMLLSLYNNCIVQGVLNGVFVTPYPEHEAESRSPLSKKQHKTHIHRSVLGGLSFMPLDAIITNRQRDQVAHGLLLLYNSALPAIGQQSRLNFCAFARQLAGQGRHFWTGDLVNRRTITYPPTVAIEILAILQYIALSGDAAPMQQQAMSAIGVIADRADKDLCPQVMLVATAVKRLTMNSDAGTMHPEWKSSAGNVSPCRRQHNHNHHDDGANEGKLHNQNSRSRANIALAALGGVTPSSDRMQRRPATSDAGNRSSVKKSLRSVPSSMLGRRSALDIGLGQTISEAVGHVAERMTRSASYLHLSSNHESSPVVGCKPAEQLQQQQQPNSQSFKQHPVNNRSRFLPSPPPSPQSASGQDDHANHAPSMFVYDDQEWFLSQQDIIQTSRTDQLLTSTEIHCYFISGDDESATSSEDSESSRNSCSF